MQGRRYTAIERAGLTALAAFTGLGFGCTGQALAQDIPDPVFAQQEQLSSDAQDRFRPVRDDDPSATGVRAGPFIVRPSLEIAGLYDSNPLARPDAASDVGVSATPRVAVDLDSGVYKITAFAQASALRYADTDTENVEQMSVGGKFEQTINSILRVRVRGEAGSYVEERSAAFAERQSATPIEYDRNNAAVSLIFTPGSFVIVPAVEVDRLGYKDNSLASAPDTLLPQGSRSFVRTEPSLLVGWAISPATALYAGGSYNRRHYDYDIPFDRDSTGYTLYGGIRFQPSGLTRLDVALGYIRQEYRGALSDPSGLYARATFDWTPTPLTLVTANVQRDVSETGALFLGGSIRTRAGLRVTHELFRNLSLNSGVEWRLIEVEQTGTSNRRLQVTGRAQYRLNRNLEWFGTGEWLVSSGDTVGISNNFDRIRARSGIRFRI